ncbi:Protein FAM57B [Larimichthys crocea]|uniref:Protein FAM57B n=1 Tax=Larimichthys crocea TaxID=215358 RepID=A0A6G0I881_LARCR|nr:Protein FAM57B [Larimichthys crocea]
MLQVLACGAVVFPGLFFAFRRILPCVFKHWSDADVVLVSERLVSSIHAIMATTAGVIVVSSCRGNIINDRHWLATYFVIWYGVPYMTYDIFAMYLSHYYRFRIKGHEEYKQHSLRTVNSFVRREFLLVLASHRPAHYPAACHTVLQKGPGGFLHRLLVSNRAQHTLCLPGEDTYSAQPPGLLGAQGQWRHYNIPLYSVPFHLPLSANLGSCCILAPQVYWFVLLCRKGYRLYRRSRMANSSSAAPVIDNRKDD